MKRINTFSNFQLSISFIVNLTTITEICQGFFQYFYIINCKTSLMHPPAENNKNYSYLCYFYIIIILHYPGIGFYVSSCPGGLTISLHRRIQYCFLPFYPGRSGFKPRTVFSCLSYEGASSLFRPPVISKERERPRNLMHCGQSILVKASPPVLQSRL